MHDLLKVPRNRLKRLEPRAITGIAKYPCGMADGTLDPPDLTSVRNFSRCVTGGCKGRGGAPP